MLRKLGRSMFKVGIVGGTGYTGVEFLRILSQHPEVSLGANTSRKEMGMTLQSFFPACADEFPLNFLIP